MGHAITTDGQVTIPKPLRDLLGLGAGDEVEFVVEDSGRVLLRKAASEADDFQARLAAARGTATNPELKGMSTDEIMQLLRGSDDD